MKAILMGLLILSTSSAFAEHGNTAGNCKLTGKLKSHDSVVVMPWVRVIRTVEVNTLQECVEAGQKFLDEVTDEYDGGIYLGKSSYRLVRFKFTTQVHATEGTLRKP